MGLFGRCSQRVGRVLMQIINLFYVTPISKIITPQTLRYGVCGVMNYIVLDAVLYYAVYHYLVEMRYVDLGLVVISPHIASLAIVFPITFLIGFWLNRYVAFDSTQRPASVQIVRYAITVCGSIIVSYISMKLLIESLGVWATPAKISSSLLTAIYGYLMSRYYTFRR